MEISEYKFQMFWAVISVVFLKHGLGALDNNELSSNSVPPLAVFLFKHCSAIVTCYSLVVAYFSRSQIHKSVNIFLTSFTLGVLVHVYFFGGSWAYCFFPTFTVSTLYNLFLIVYDNGDFASHPNHKWQLVIYAGYTMSATIFAGLSAFDTTNSENHGYCVYAFCLCASCIYEFDEQRRGESLPTTDTEHHQNLTTLDGNSSNRMKRWIEFAVGLLGTILFQNFFKANSFKQVVAFIYLAVAWLASITVLRGKTWIAYGASVFLYSLRLKLQSLSCVNTQCGNRKVILW